MISLFDVHLSHVHHKQPPGLLIDTCSFHACKHAAPAFSQRANGRFVKLEARTFVVNYTLYARIERKRGTHLYGTIRRRGFGGKRRRIKRECRAEGKRGERDTAYPGERERRVWRREEGGKGGEGWFQLGGSNSPRHCSFHSRFVFPVCLFPLHLR